MRLDMPIKIMYGCIVGRFAQKVFTLLAGKRGSLYGDNQIAGMFAVYVKPLLCKTILAYIKCLAFSNTISYI